jgi:small-conductance mechanosensitive channel
VLETLDGWTVHLPNQMVTDSPLVNRSTRGRTRSTTQVRVRCSPDDDATPLADALEETVAGVAGVLATPAPEALLVEAGPERVTFNLQYWHLPDAAPQVPSRVAGAVRELGRKKGRDATVVTPPPVSPPPAPSEL